MANLYTQQLIRKSMDIIKSEIQVSITKTQLTTIINEALLDETAGPAIKRILNPLLTDSFKQFPTFSNVTLGTTDESGSTIVTLREPREQKPKLESEPATTEEDVNTESEEETAA